MTHLVVAVRTLSPAIRLVIRGGDAAVARMDLAIGVDFPREPCRAAMEGSRAVLWVGPDEWLLIAPDDSAEVLVAAMNEALGAVPASIVEVSDRNVAIEVAGPKAAEALNAFNPLDLDQAAFPIGMCTRTLFGKAEIVLWRTSPETFRIEVWRSFAPYVLSCLEEVCREYGAGTRPDVRIGDE
jgi:sarcosine oxidase subunit gamma